MSSQALLTPELDRSDRNDRHPHDSALTAAVRAATTGDGRAWEFLVARFTPTLRAAARGFKLSPADVDDVVQDTWVAAIRHIGRLENPAAVGGWLVVIARRESLRLLQRRAQEELTDEPPEPREPDDRSPESLAIDADERANVHAAVARLPERQRRVLEALADDTATGYADISQRLEMPIGSIGPTRDRAIERLRRDRRLGCAELPSRAEALAPEVEDRALAQLLG